MINAAHSLTNEFCITHLLVDDHCLFHYLFIYCNIIHKLEPPSPAEYESSNSFTSDTEMLHAAQKLDCCGDCYGQAGRDQPVVDQAAAVTSDAVDNRYTGRYNAAPQVIYCQ